ncbi:MAG: hypothetical protein ACRDYC_13080 [Acidimicrobiales bacterium]
MTYGNVPGTRNDTFDCKGNVFADTFPNLVLAALGGPDVVTGSGPYVHTMKLLNAAATGSQPPSYTLVDVDQITESADAAKQMGDAQLGSLDMDFAATGALNWTAKFFGNPFTEVVVPTPSFSTEIFIPAWSGTISFGGDAAPIISGSFNMTRSNTAPIFTVGQQGPYRNWAGPIEVTGTLVLLALAGDTTMTEALLRNAQVATLTFTEPVSSHSVAWTMSQVQFKNPKVARSKEYVTITCDFEAEGDTTDASTGYSPMSFVATNAQMTAY